MDRNEQCAPAVQAARELARQHGAEIVVQYVDPVLVSVLSARRFVGDIMRRLRAEGVVARTAGLAGVGGVASQIAAEADRVDADVIVIGSRRRGDVAALVLGSVTRDLMRRTMRPVLLAEAAERQEQEVGGMSAAAGNEPRSGPAADPGRIGGQVR